MNLTHLRRAAWLGLWLCSLLACAAEPEAIPRGTPAPTLLTTRIANAPPSSTPRARAATATRFAPTATQPSLPSPTPTLAPTPTRAAAPQVLAFTANPTITQKVGDTITFNWQAVGETASLCPSFGTLPDATQCQAVPLSGRTTLNIDESMLPYTHYGLRATLGQQFVWATVAVHLQCHGLRAWFFSKPPQRCPANPPAPTSGAAQRFEHGFMLWTRTPDAFYVFFDEPTVQPFPRVVDIIHDPRSRLKPNASPDHRLGVKPPAGRYEPVSGFGMVWRNELENIDPSIRSRLGWGLENEFALNLNYQCETPSHPRSWTCYLQMMDEQVVRLQPDSTAQVRILWDVYGKK